LFEKLAVNRLALVVGFITLDQLDDPEIYDRVLSESK
jgi:hypothetical protein